jgi:hypothetical protein
MNHSCSHTEIVLDVSELATHVKNMDTAFLLLFDKGLSAGSASPVQTVIENTPQLVISAQPIPL